MEKKTDTYPLLSKINSPADLRRLPVTELPAVCRELRSFLIDSLSDNPGHFASSMGAVEITVALHYVFDTPYDRVVWDVGHQAYSHKILTGRRDAFATNRKMGGLSGFPNPEESEYDSFIAGHASNSISAALGMAIASRIKGEPRRNVIAVIGDASIAGGLAFEGLNNAAASKSNLLIVLNDNDMAIANNVGSLNKYLVNITTSKSYNTLRYKVYRFFRKFHLITESHRGIILRFNNSLKSLISRQQNIFEGLNIRYFGPYDGHDVVRLVRVFSDLKAMDGPILLHLRTVKGKGYAPAEENPCLWHAPGKFNKETGDLIKPADDGRLKYQDVFGKTLVELAEKNQAIVGITAAMPTGCSMTFMQERFPKRTFDVGISEGHAVTFSGGLAKDGARPFCCIYSTFLQRGFDMLIHDVSLLGLHTVFCVDRAGLVGNDGETHQGVFDVCYLSAVPGMTILCPASFQELHDMLGYAIHEVTGPAAVRYPRGGEGRYTDSLMQAENLIREGTDVTVVCYGTMINEVLNAADELQSRGVSAEIIKLGMIAPNSFEQCIGSVRKTGRLLVAEEVCSVGCVGSALLAAISVAGVELKAAELLNLGDGIVRHGTVDELRRETGIDAASIAAAGCEMCRTDTERV